MKDRTPSTALGPTPESPRHIIDHGSAGLLFEAEIARGEDGHHDAPRPDDEQAATPAPLAHRALGAFAPGADLRFADDPAGAGAFGLLSQSLLALPKPSVAPKPDGTTPALHPSASFATDETAVAHQETLSAEDEDELSGADLRRRPPAVGPHAAASFGTDEIAISHEGTLSPENKDELSGDDLRRLPPAVRARVAGPLGTDETATLHEGPLSAEDTAELSGAEASAEHPELHGVAHGTRSDLAQHVTTVNGAIAAKAAAPLPDVGANEVFAVERAAATLGGVVATRRRPDKGADPLPLAEQTMAELQAKGDAHLDAIAQAEQAKTSQVHVASEARAAEHQAQSAVEEERARAKAKAAEAEARRHAEAEHGKQAVTIASLKADLARSLDDEHHELTEENARAKADLHARFEERRLELRAQADAGPAGRAVRLAETEQAAARLDLTKQKAVLQVQAAEQAEALKGKVATGAQALAQAAVADAQRLDAEAEVQAKQALAKGEADAAALKANAKEHAAAARAEGANATSQARVAAVTRTVGSGADLARNLGDGELRARMATDTAEETAKKIEQQGEDGAAKLKLESERAATRLRTEAKQQHEKRAAQAKSGAAAIAQQAALAEARQKQDVQLASARLDSDLERMTVGTRQAADKAREVTEEKIATALAKLAAEETSAAAKLDAQLEKRLGEVDRKGAAAEKKLELGKASDIRRLERMVHAATADIDRASLEAARQIDAIRKEADKKAKAEIAKQVTAIAAAGRTAMVAIQAVVTTTRKQIQIDAEAGQRQLALEGRRGMDAVEKEGERQAIALEAEARKGDAALAARGDAERAALDKRADAGAAAMAGMNDDLKTDLQGVMTMDLTAAKQAAEGLQDAMDRWGTNEEGVYRALAMARTPAEMRAIKAAYKARTGRELDADLAAELSGSELRKAKALESTDPVRIAVATLENAQGGLISRTDDGTIQATLAGISDPAMKSKVAREYQRTTGKRLTTMLEDELAGEGLAKAMGELADMPPLDDKLAVDPEKMKQVNQKAMGEAAAELRRAMDGLGTKEDAIHDALRGKTPEEIETIKDIYRRHYHVELIDQLESEMAGTDLKEATAALSGNPVDAAVARLENAMDGAGTDEKKIHDVLEGIEDPEQRRAVIDEFERQTGRTLAVALDSEMSGADQEIAGTLLMADNHERLARAAAIRLDAASGDGALGDKDDICAVLEKARTKDEREAIAAAYQARTGVSLRSMLESKLFGTDRDLATALASGDSAGAAAARVADASRGTFGAHEKDIFAQLEGKTAKEREALKAAYDATYGRAKGGLDFDEMIADKLSGMDLEKARLLEEHGKVPVEFALEYAMEGRGTDEAAIKKTLANKSPGEVQAIREAYRLKYHKDLDTELHGELAGRDDFEVGLLLEGEPQDAAGKLERARKKYEYERGGGEGSTGLGAAMTDLFSDAGADLDRSHEEMLALEQELKAQGVVRTGKDGKLEMVPGGQLDAGAQKRLEEGYDWQNLDVKGYEEAKDSVTSGLAEVTAVVVGGAVTILTAGAAAPAVLAALSALAGGGASIAVKMAMQGGAYGVDDIGIDAAKTLLQAATAGAMRSQLVMGKLEKAAGALTGQAAGAVRRVTTSALSGAAAGSLSSMIDAGLDPETSRDLGDWLHHVISAGGTGAFSGAVGGTLGHVKYSPGNGLIDATLEAPTTLRGAAVRGLVSGVTGSVAPMALSGLYDPAVFSGRSEDILHRFVKSGTIAAAQGAFDAMGGFRQEAAAHAAAHVAGEGSGVVDYSGGGSGASRTPSGGEGHDAPTLRYSQVDTVVDAPATHEGHADGPGHVVLESRWSRDASGPSITGVLETARAGLDAWEATHGPIDEAARGEFVHRVLAGSDAEDVARRASAGPHPEPTEIPIAAPTGVDDGVAQETLLVPHEELGPRSGRTRPMPAVGEVPADTAPAGRGPTVLAPLEGGVGPGLEDVHVRRALRPSEVETAVRTVPVVDVDAADSVRQERLELPYEELGARTGRTEPMATVAGEPTERIARPPELLAPAAAMDGAPMHVWQPPAAQAPAPSRFAALGPREAMQLLKNLPGVGHYKGVIPDHFPATKGWLRLSDAQRLLDVYTHLMATPTGRSTLDVIRKRKVQVTSEREKGTYFRPGSWRKPRVINLDPNTFAAAHNAAGGLAHEGHHALTHERDVRAHKQGRDEYMSAALRNEAEAQARLFDHHREAAQRLGVDHGRENGGHAEYSAEYDRALAAYRREGYAPEQAHAWARELATRKLADWYGNGLPSTSMMTDPATGRQVIRPGAPRTYRELYGSHWEAVQKYENADIWSKLRSLISGKSGGAAPATPEISVWEGPDPRVGPIPGHDPQTSSPAGEVSRAVEQLPLARGTGSVNVPRELLATYDAPEAMRVLQELPGTGHIQGIIPDDWPTVAGCLRLSEAQALIHAYDRLSVLPGGQDALRVMAERGVQVAPDAVGGTPSVKNEVGVTARHFERLAALSPEDQTAYHTLLQTAENPSQRAILERAAAAGHPIADIDALAQRMRGLDQDTIRARYTEEGHLQGFQNSCVPTSMQVMAMAVDPIYAEWVFHNPEAAVAEQQVVLEQQGKRRARDITEPREQGGMFAMQLEGSRVLEIVERSTSSRYKAYVNTGGLSRQEVASQVPVFGQHDWVPIVATPHEAIQQNLRRQKPVLVGGEKHARALVGMTEDSGNVVYIMHDPMTGVRTPLTPAELDALTSNPGDNFMFADAPGPESIAGSSSGSPARVMMSTVGDAGPGPIDETVRTKDLQSLLTSIAGEIHDLEMRAASRDPAQADAVREQLASLRSVRRTVEETLARTVVAAREQARAEVKAKRQSFDFLHPSADENTRSRVLREWHDAVSREFALNNPDQPPIDYHREYRRIMERERAMAPVADEAQARSRSDSEPNTPPATKRPEMAATLEAGVHELELEIERHLQGLHGLDTYDIPVVATHPAHVESLQRAKLAHEDTMSVLQRILESSDRQERELAPRPDEVEPFFDDEVEAKAHRDRLERVRTARAATREAIDAERARYAAWLLAEEQAEAKRIDDATRRAHQIALDLESAVGVFDAAVDRLRERIDRLNAEGNEAQELEAQNRLMRILAARRVVGEQLERARDATAAAQPAGPARR